MKTAFLALVVCLVAATLVAGCGESGGPNPKVEAKRVEDLTAMRAFYDKVSGNYDQLPEADKAEFVKLCGGEQAVAKTTWDAMKYGPGGPPR